MYKNAKKPRKAADKPIQRDIPFHPKVNQFMVEATNDPTGRQEYSSNPYREDKRLNWQDRS